MDRTLAATLDSWALWVQMGQVFFAMSQGHMRTWSLKNPKELKPQRTLKNPNPNPKEPVIRSYTCGFSFKPGCSALFWCFLLSMSLVYCLLVVLFFVTCLAAMNCFCFNSATTFLLTAVWGAKNRGRVPSTATRHLLVRQVQVAVPQKTMDTCWMMVCDRTGRKLIDQCCG